MNEHLPDLYLRCNASTKTFAVTVLSLFSMVLFAQPGHHIFGGDGDDSFQQILPIDDSTFYLLGSKDEGNNKVWLVKMNDRCEVLMERTYVSSTSDLFGHRAVMLNDGSLMIVGIEITNASFNNLKSLALKLDKDGNLEWIRSYENAHTLNDVIEHNGTLLFAGWYDNTGSSESGILLSTDADGSELWHQELRVHNQTIPKRIFKVSEDEVIVAGRSNVIGVGFQGVFLHRMNVSGEAIWTRSFSTGYRDSSLDEEDYFFESLGLSLTDTSVWIVNPTRRDIILLHIDFNGELLAQQFHGTTEELEYPYALTALPENKFLIAGRTDQAGLVSLVSNGVRELWTEYIKKDNGITRYFDAIPIKEGFLLAGMATANQSFPGAFDGLVTRIRDDGSVLPWRVNGQVLFDTEGQCNPTQSGLPVSAWFVRIAQASMLSQPDTFEIVTDKNGKFSFYSDTRISKIHIHNPDPASWNVCGGDQTIISNMLNPEVSVTFLVQQIDPCLDVEINITQPDLVRCDTSCAVITLLNESLSESTGYSLSINMDPELTFVSCSEPHVIVDEQIEVEILPMEGRMLQNVDLCFALHCDVNLGTTQRVSATLRELNCAAAYDGPHYVVKGRCTGDQVEFVARNVGGEALSLTTYRLFADQILIVPETAIDLRSADSHETLILPADGRTWLLELYQDSAFPGHYLVSDEVESCGVGIHGFSSFGYANNRTAHIEAGTAQIQMTNSTGINFDIVECTAGLGRYHILDTIQTMEFAARAKNVLSSTIHSAEFILTLSEAIDPKSFEVLASTGPTEVSFSGSTIIVAMENIEVYANEDVMVRFSVRALNPPDEDENSFFEVSGKVILNEDQQFFLFSGFHNFLRSIVVTEDLYNVYADNFLLFGGRYPDFGSCIARTDDNHLFIGGESSSFSNRNYNDGWIAKTDARGKVLWYTAIDHLGGENTFRSIVALPDGGCIAIGNYGPFGLSGVLADFHVFLVRLGDDGKVIWKNIYRPSGDQYGAWTPGMIETTDGHFVVYGYCHNDGGAGGVDQYYFKINEDGHILWSQHVPVVGSAFHPYAAAATSDGGFVLIGENISTNLNYRIFLERVDSEGNSQWTKGFNSQLESDYLSCLTEAPDGSILAGGYGYFIAEPDYINATSIVKFAPDGGLLWEKYLILGDSSISYANDILHLPDNTFLLTGAARYDALGSEIFLAKIDQDGDTLWTNHYGALNDESGQEIVRMRNDSIAIVGYNQQRPPFYNLQATLVVTDQFGNTRVSVQDPRPRPEMAVTVLPNPASEYVSVIFTPEPLGLVAWNLYSLDGRLASSGESTGSSLVISLESLASGYYFLAFPGSHYPSRKLVVIRPTK